MMDGQDGFVATPCSSPDYLGSLPVGFRFGEGTRHGRGLPGGVEGLVSRLSGVSRAVGPPAFLSLGLFQSGEIMEPSAGLCPAGLVLT